VVGVSPSIVEEALTTQNAGFTQQPHRFLEKIIEYPSYLPEVKLDTLRGFIDHQATALDDTSNKDMLATIGRVAPGGCPPGAQTNHRRNVALLSAWREVSQLHLHDHLLS
jgi:hypothetical protein